MGQPFTPPRNHLAAIAFYPAVALWLPAGAVGKLAPVSLQFGELRADSPMRASAGRCCCFRVVRLRRRTPLHSTAVERPRLQGTAGSCK